MTTQIIDISNMKHQIVISRELSIDYISMMVHLTPAIMASVLPIPKTLPLQGTLTRSLEPVINKMRTIAWTPNLGGRQSLSYQAAFIECKWVWWRFPNHN